MSSEYVTARQAADMTGHSERTIRRMIADGRLRARRVAINRYEIALVDLPVKKRDPLDELRRRVEELERRVRTLEAQNSRQHVSEPNLGERAMPPLREDLHTPLARPTASVARQTSRGAGGLPDGFVSVAAFAAQHGMAESQRSTWRKAITTGRLPHKHKPEKWKHHGTHVEWALDAEGRRVFCELWRDAAWFHPCEECPHE